MNIHGWDDYALSLAKSMTELKLYEDILYERTFKGFYPGFWSSKEPNGRLETLKLFLRHYVLNIRKMKVEDLYSVNLGILVKQAKLWGIIQMCWESKIIRCLIYCFPELNILQFKRLPRTFLDSEENRIIVIKHFIEKQEKLADEQIYKIWGKEYLKLTRLNTLLANHRYTPFGLLELAYPGKFNIEKFNHTGLYTIGGNKHPIMCNYPVKTIAKIFFIIGCYYNTNVVTCNLADKCKVISKDVHNYIVAVGRRNYNRITITQWKEKIKELQESGEIPTIDFDNLTDEERFKMKLIAVRKLKDYIQLNDDVLEWYEENKDRDYPRN